MDVLPDYGNMDVMLENGISNSTEIEQDNVTNRPDGHQDFESYLIGEVHLRKMRLGTLITEMARLGKTVLQSLLKYYQAK